MRMAKIGLHKHPGFLAAALCGAPILPALAADDAANKIPDFMAGGMGWNSARQLTSMPGRPRPVVQDPKVKYMPNNIGRQPTQRVADFNDANLTPFTHEQRT